ncbi:hypothetical protein [Paracoccus spongiarum]|uniref:Glycosyl transferase family 2 n=1 Tax=Paracoccus spongiarum TaxID=3064387 RepID=A0ABT9JCR9_9RHOB|nr:hypothetical protein [Paracoccus sp. 2205BS29-5]MDP5307410.1 hypothetical protein [Paracoccus sp. 2205BS29-5]
MSRPRRVACLTMLRDEEFFFPIWYRYYASLFGRENLFVIDHLSKTRPAAPDGSGALNMLTLPFERALDPQGRPQKLDGPRFRLISGMVEGLLAYYDTVIFNDTDELFIVDPQKHRDLRSFLEGGAGKAPALAGMGLDIIHDPRSEPALDPARPVLAQRRNYVCAPVWAKPHIINTACKIAPHGLSIPFRFDPDLYLIHLKHSDITHTLQRQAVRHEMYRQDAVADFCTWQATAAEKDTELAALLERPLDEGDLPHRRPVARLLANGPNHLLGSETGPARKRPSKVMPWAYKVHEFLPAPLMQSLRQSRHLFPARFAGATGEG